MLVLETWNFNIVCITVLSRSIKKYIEQFQLSLGSLRIFEHLKNVKFSTVI